METAEKRKAYDRYFYGYMQNLNAAEQANMERILQMENATAWKEYDAAATQLAYQGKTGKIGDALPENMSPEAVRLINDDPEAFQAHVRRCAYAIAMGERL